MPANQNTSLKGRDMSQPISRQEQFSGTKDVAPQHMLDAAKLERYLSEHVAGFEGPLTIRQFKGGQSNPTYQLITPKRKYVLRSRHFRTRMRVAPFVARTAPRLYLKAAARIPGCCLS